LAPLGLVPLASGDDRLMFPEDFEAFRSFKDPKAPRYALVGSLDGLFHLRRDLMTLIAPEDGKRAVFVDHGFESLGGLSDLPSHAIVDRGRLVGLWEYDPERAEIVWRTFDAPDKALDAAIARTQAYVSKDLGDARSFSLDSPKSRAPRVEALRKVREQGPRGRTKPDGKASRA